MSCDTTSFVNLFGMITSLIFGVACVGFGITCFISTDGQITTLSKQFLEDTRNLKRELWKTKYEKMELEEKLGRVYNSFETFKSELVGLEKYDDVPPVPPPAERTETYIDNNSIPAGPDEFEKVD
jgi:hypothetical protein